MKTKLLVLLPIMCLFLSSCFDLEETYNLKDDGSYTVNYSVNMGSVLGLISAMVPDSVKQSKKFSTAKDTVMSLADLPDSVSRKLNVEEKEMLRNTDMRMQMNMGEGVFRIGFMNKGKSVEDLRYFLTNLGSTMQKSKMASKMMEAPGMPAGNNEAPEMPIKNGDYDYTIDASTFGRKKKTVVKDAKSEEDKKMLQMVKNMKLSMTNVVTINLPRPAKSVSNPAAVLSADKKQVKFTVNLIEATEKPELLDFKIVY